MLTDPNHRHTINVHIKFSSKSICKAFIRPFIFSRLRLAQVTHYMRYALHATLNARRNWVSIFNIYQKAVSINLIFVYFIQIFKLRSILGHSCKHTPSNARREIQINKLKVSHSLCTKSDSFLIANVWTVFLWPKVMSLQASCWSQRE